MNQQRFVSAVNQPSRVYLSSYDDTTEDSANELRYNNFRCFLPTPILNAEKCQLLRASIPNAQVSIPDYQLEFWYVRYEVADSTHTPEYRCIRFYPSTWVGQTNGCPVNRIIANYQDFVTLLNEAASATEDVALNPLFTQNDVSFAYDGTTRKITMTGLTAGYTYRIAGYNEPGVENLRQDIYLAAGIPQPSIQGKTLNLRVGFCFPGTQPVPYTVSVAANTAIVPESWGDLVYSQNVLLLTNIVPGSSVGSGGQHNILASVPIAAPPLGVGQYSAPLVNWMTRIMKEIYEIQIRMLDDNYQPYNVPQNAVVNIELGFRFMNETY